MAMLFVAVLAFRFVFAGQAGFISRAKNFVARSIIISRVILIVSRVFSLFVARF